jgi:hypothetical protein
VSVAQRPGVCYLKRDAFVFEPIQLIVDALDIPSPVISFSITCSWDVNHAAYKKGSPSGDVLFRC